MGDSEESVDVSSVVYQIDCKDCDKIYQELGGGRENMKFSYFLNYFFFETIDFSYLINGLELNPVLKLLENVTGRTFKCITTLQNWKWINETGNYIEEHQITHEHITERIPLKNNLHNCKGFQKKHRGIQESFGLREGEINKETVAYLEFGSRGGPASPTCTKRTIFF